MRILKLRRTSWALTYRIIYFSFTSFKRGTEEAPRQPKTDVSRCRKTVRGKSRDSHPSPLIPDPIPIPSFCEGICQLGTPNARSDARNTQRCHRRPRSRVKACGTDKGKGQCVKRCRLGQISSVPNHTEKERLWLQREGVFAGGTKPLLQLSSRRLQ